MNGHVRERMSERLRTACQVGRQRSPWHSHANFIPLQRLLLRIMAKYQEHADGVREFLPLSLNDEPVTVPVR